MILTAIQHHFTVELERPELLSRIGDNIIVFDPITAEVGRRLVARHFDAVTEAVRLRLGTELVLADAVHRKIEEYALTKLPFGGRGIATAVETALVNPLARQLADARAHTHLRVLEAHQELHDWSLTVAFSDQPIAG
jgi:ATP-dependent Clp protease ATP-binding subunit ClpA